MFSMCAVSHGEREKVCIITGKTGEKEMFVAEWRWMFIDDGWCEPLNYISITKHTCPLHRSLLSEKIIWKRKLIYLQTLWPLAYIYFTNVMIGMEKKCKFLHITSIIKIKTSFKWITCTKTALTNIKHNRCREKQLIVATNLLLRTCLYM